MTAFDSGWSVLKEFRFEGGFPGILTQGGYDSKTDTPYANLASHVADFKDGSEFRSDRELMDRVMRILSHENMHQALHPPYTDDLWNAVSMSGVSRDEKERLQEQVDRDWERFQEYGAWTGTQGIDEDEKWRMLGLYGIHRKNDGRKV